VPSPNDRKYTPSHEWIQVDGKSATVGLSEFAIHAIKDIVFLELPSVGQSFDKLKAFGVIESVKAVFDLNCPMAGTVTQVNSALVDDFETLAKDCYTKGWLIKIDLKGEDGSQLMDGPSYDKFCAEEHH
jgi:glycine cleavage system H protein